MAPSLSERAEHRIIEQASGRSKDAESGNKQQDTFAFFSSGQAISLMGSFSVRPEFAFLPYPPPSPPQLDQIRIGPFKRLAPVILLFLTILRCEGGWDFLDPQKLIAMGSGRWWPLDGVRYQTRVCLLIHIILACLCPQYQLEASFANRVPSSETFSQFGLHQPIYHTLLKLELYRRLIPKRLITEPVYWLEPGPTSSGSTRYI